MLQDTTLGQHPADHSKKIKDTLGLEFKYHYLRHTYGTRLAEQNMPAHLLCNQMGHANSKVTEKYINEDDSLDVLIKAALIHYQFETIHPFLDGNGRVGRLLITLFLLDKQALHYPALYISYYLKLSRIEYYDRMSEVRAKDNYEQWVKFFLLAIKESAEDAIDAIKQLSALHDKNVAIIETLGRQSKTARLLFGYIEKNPIIDIGKTASDLEVSFNTASSYIHRLVDCGILVQTNNTERKRVFSYEDYLSILRKNT